MKKGVQIYSLLGLYVNELNRGLAGYFHQASTTNPLCLVKENNEINLVPLAYSKQVGINWTERRSSQSMNKLASNAQSLVEHSFAIWL